jgi:hypothetical protein
VAKVLSARPFTNQDTAKNSRANASGQKIGAPVNEALPAHKMQTSIAAPQEI